MLFQTMQKKRQVKLSPKQLSEFEGQEKHIWHQKLKRLTEIRFRELADVGIYDGTEGNEKDLNSGRRKHDQSKR